MANLGQNMMLINSSFRGVKSFSLIPLTDYCPYSEVMFDPASSVLAVITKIEKKMFRMVPQLDEDGKPKLLRVPNKQTGEIHKKERVEFTTLTEFYITEKSEITDFIKIFAINGNNFDISKFFVDLAKTEQSKLIIP